MIHCRAQDNSELRIRICQYLHCTVTPLTSNHAQERSDKHMRSCILIFHLDIAFLAQVLKHIAPLEVLVRVHNSLQLVRRHGAFIFGLLDLRLVKMLENTTYVSYRSLQRKEGTPGSGTKLYRLHAMWYFWVSLSSLTPCNTERSDTPIDCINAVKFSKLKCLYGHPWASPGPGGCSVRIFDNYTGYSRLLADLCHRLHRRTSASRCIDTPY